MAETHHKKNREEGRQRPAAPVLRKLRVRMICVIMAIVTVVLFLILGIIYTVTERNLEVDSIRMMDLLASEPAGPGRPEDVKEGEGIRLPYFTVELSFDGEILATTGSYFDLSDEEYLGEITAAAREADSDIGELSQYGLRYDKAHFGENGRIVFCDISAEHSTLNGLLRNCLLIGIGAWGLLLLLSVVLSRLLLRPVERAWQNQRQFVSDASHELKTPLAVILTDAEMLQSGEYDEEMQHQLLDNVLAMSRSMRGLVEELLELARLDGGAPQTQFTQVDLSAVVEEAVLPFEPLFFEKGIALHTSVEEGITLQGSETYLRRLPEIFLDNALKYTAAGGRAVLRLQKTGNDCLLSVSNTGEEIPERDLQNIFRRFYRVDASRHGSGSYGLGLSIAQQTVQMHRGRIWAESGEGTNTFCVQLPLEEKRRWRG